MGTDRDYVSAAIARCLAIEAAGAPAREILRQGARTIALKSDAVVFAGEADGAALILRGVAAVYSEPRSGGEACLALFGPGDAIERTVALGERRGARRIVRALTNMEALLIDAKALQRARQADVAVAAALGEKSTEVAARFAEQSSDLALCDAETRLARRLVQMLSFLHGPTSRKTTLGKITQSQLAAVIGVSRKRINTILAMWFRSGLLFQDRSGVIDVLDARRLSAIADSEGALDDAPQFLGSIDHLLDAGLNDEAKTLALEAVEREPREAAYHHRAALAAARLGQLAEALDLIAAADRLKPPPDIGEMIAGLKGRVLKNMADVADPPARSEIYAQAGEAYAAAYESYNGVYSAVNAAACFAIAGDERAGGFAARSLGAQAGEDAPQTYYELASIGEARLLQNDLSAPEWFAAALAAPDATAAKTGATRGQLKR
ncbi:MAG: Crp/Fnr family transcriptional regulator, partial [Pseudomonadota bacterium]